MTSAAQQKWDARYRESGVGLTPPARVLLDFLHLLPAKGRAVDVACGLGSNAICLAQRGLEVAALDISPVAVGKVNDYARINRLPIVAEAVDLAVESDALPASAFDVIVVTRYLERSICPALARTLRPGGLLFYQTFTEDSGDVPGVPKNPDYLLRRGELLDLFRSLHCVVYRDESRIGSVDEGFRNEAMFIGQQSRGSSGSA